MLTRMIAVVGAFSVATHRNLFRLLTVGVMAAMSSMSSASDVVPTSVTVQGRLTDSSGNPLPAGLKTFTFRIYDWPTAGNKVWPEVGSEVQPLESDADGLWTAAVGAFVPLREPVFATWERWLEIDVDETTLPRVRLFTTPYAFRVATVDKAAGGAITSKVSIGSGHTNSGADAFVAGVDNQLQGAAYTRRAWSLDPGACRAQIEAELSLRPVRSMGNLTVPPAAVSIPCLRHTA